jgi:hypothetical protein
MPGSSRKNDFFFGRCAGRLVPRWRAGCAAGDGVPLDTVALSVGSVSVGLSVGAVSAGLVSATTGGVPSEDRAPSSVVIARVPPSGAAWPHSHHAGTRDAR